MHVTQTLGPAEPRLPKIVCQVIDCADGPSSRPGTYVFLMNAPQSSEIRVGALGTFSFPTGYYLYVGSALQGVKRRTDRHRGPNARPWWNIDYLKPVTHPLELWWFYSKERLECRLAMTLASGPGMTCPAPQFGAQDCRKCPAHLFHSLERPSAQSFVERVYALMPNYSAVYRQMFQTKPQAE